MQSEKKDIAQIREELKKFINVASHVGQNGMDVTNKFFTKPVECIFDWCEPRWDGLTYTLWKYPTELQTYYIAVEVCFGPDGSFDVFEAFSTVEQTRPKMEDILETSVVVTDLKLLLPSKIQHCDLKKSLNNFLFRNQSL